MQQMQFPKFSHIPQSVFSTQNDDERIFIFARRHVLSFLSWQLVTISLALVPIIFAIVVFEGLLAIVASLPIFIDDLIIILVMVYYLSLVVVFMTNWVRYYYTYIIITDERVYSTAQSGYFNRIPHEFTLEEVQEVTYKVRGPIGIIFNKGDILVHFEGSAQGDYMIKSVFKANIISLIISSLIEQANNKVPPQDRMPDAKIFGLLENKTVTRDDQPPAIMNFTKSVSKAQQVLKKEGSLPRGLRQKFDLWWWTQLKKEHEIYIDYSPTDLKEIAQNKEGKDSVEKGK